MVALRLIYDGKPDWRDLYQCREMVLASLIRANVTIPRGFRWEALTPVVLIEAQVHYTSSYIL